MEFESSVFRIFLGIICVFDIEYLIIITKQKSFKMPSGLTREERRVWAKENKNDKRSI